MVIMTVILLLGILVTAWIAYLAIDSPEPRRYYGSCDTTGCRNNATVHHGLEEWYCEPCDRNYNGRS